MPKNLKWTLRFGMLTPILILIAIFLAGGGHGYFEPIFILFPFSCISIIFFNEINLLFIFIALIQYPIYGLLLDKMKVKNIAFFIILAHLFLAITTYVLRPINFS
ncbi:hypothetical protein [Flavobacterium sp. ZB4P13]|uniref:hypothetical protein n=1 Tax=Flavobacterium sp. ZB4P13 TaxID=3401728 RepID=UPI003AAAFAC2